ncbi:DUF3098 domain-containing protein [bacterium]|nr:DUF3098 domain-containing protein [bacterium]
MAKNKQTKKTSTSENSQNYFVFGKKNYRLMVIGIAIIAVGFALMYGKEDIYDFRKTTLAPIVVIAGFVVEVFAILTKPEAENESN